MTLCGNFMPSDINAPYVGAPMANGGIGILPWKEPFSVRQVILNHVFDTDGPQGVSRVLKGINPFLMSMDVDGKEVNTECITNWKQCVEKQLITVVSGQPGKLMWVIAFAL